MQEGGTSEGFYAVRQTAGFSKFRPQVYLAKKSTGGKKTPHTRPLRDVERVDASLVYPWVGVFASPEYDGPPRPCHGSFDIFSSLTCIHTERPRAARLQPEPSPHPTRPDAPAPLLRLALPARAVELRPCLAPNLAAPSRTDGTLRSALAAMRQVGLPTSRAHLQARRQRLTHSRRFACFLVPLAASPRQKKRAGPCDRDKGGVSMPSGGRLF